MAGSLLGLGLGVLAGGQAALGWEAAPPPAAGMSAPLESVPAPLPTGTLTMPPDVEVRPEEEKEFGGPAMPGAEMSAPAAAKAAAAPAVAPPVESKSPEAASPWRAAAPAGQKEGNAAALPASAAPAPAAAVENKPDGPLPGAMQQTALPAVGSPAGQPEVLPPGFTTERNQMPAGPAQAPAPPATGTAADHAADTPVVTTPEAPAAPVTGTAVPATPAAATPTSARLGITLAPEETHPVPSAPEQLNLSPGSSPLSTTGPSAGPLPMPGGPEQPEGPRSPGPGASALMQPLRGAPPYRSGLPSADEEAPEASMIQLEPPGPEVVFRRESEGALHERMRQQALDLQRPERIDFPEEPVLSREAYPGRHFPPMTELAEANYTCYRRLYFEDLNSERYGWDLGFIQPLVSTGIFFYDLVLLPYHAGTEPCRKYECSAGYCLPGDPVPYLLYPPELSLTGAIFEAGTVVSLYAIFPGF